MNFYSKTVEHSFDAGSTKAGRIFASLHHEGAWRESYAIAEPGPKK